MQSQVSLQEGGRGTLDTEEEEAVWPLAEIGVMRPQAKEAISHQKRLEEARTDSPQNLQRDLSPAHTLILV